MKPSLIFIFFLISNILASPGDNLRRFNRCVSKCEQINCFDSNIKRSWDFKPFNKYLKLLYWDCYQDCDYQCQQFITNERKKYNQEIYQFHGKWPFKRIFGIQEFMSSLFSLGNLIPNYLSFRKLYKNLSICKNEQSKKFLKVIIFSNIITCLAWLASTIFHIRDFTLTERLDYFLAGATVLSGFYSIFIRNFRLYLKERLVWFYIFTGFCLSLYSYHLTRLIIDWSYTYNMRANILIAILQNLGLFWLCYDLYSQYFNLNPSLNHLNYTNKILLSSFFKKSAKLYCLYPILLSLIIIIGMSLEIFDFSPIFYDLIDAHSLWHLVTIIPVIYGWYDWLIWDIHENVSKDKEIISKEVKLKTD